MRASPSETLPGPNGTTMRTNLFGYGDSAHVAEPTHRSIAIAAAVALSAGLPSSRIASSPFAVLVAIRRPHYVRVASVSLRLASHHDAAIHVETDSGHVGRLVGREIQGRVGDVLGQSDPTKRDLRDDAVLLSWQPFVGERRACWSGRDRVDGDTKRPKRLGERASEAD